jgi:hypothetical protein
MAGAASLIPAGLVAVRQRGLDVPSGTDALVGVLRRRRETCEPQTPPAGLLDQILTESLLACFGVPEP